MFIDAVAHHAVRLRQHLIVRADIAQQTRVETRPRRWAPARPHGVLSGIEVGVQLLGEEVLESRREPPRQCVFTSVQQLLRQIHVHVGLPVY